MRRIVLVLALLALACAREQKPQVTPQRCDGLCGNVVDARTKQPVREFTVYVMANRPGVQIALPPGYPHPPGMMINEQVITSDDGSFVLRAPEHPVTLMISARGYNGFTTQEVDGSTRITIELTRARQIEGHVADDRGHPIANAHVSETMSDANGNFVIDEPPGEWRQLDVSDEQHLPSRLIVHQNDTRIDVTLHDAFELAGVVQDPNGKPFSEAGVQVRCGNAASEAQVKQRDGTFSFRVPNAHCTVTAGWGLRDDDVQHEVVPMEPRTTIELEHPRTGVVLRLRS